MPNRYVAIWFPHLLTDRLIIRRPDLQKAAFVLAAPERGRMMVKATNTAVEAAGIFTGMVVADAKAVLPMLQVMEYKPGNAEKLLEALARWCVRYTPLAATDPPDGLLLDVSGCPHLWGGERPYLKDIITRLKNSGYDTRAAIASTIGTAWAIARYGKVTPVIESGTEADALLPLPPPALRLEPGIVARMDKLGLKSIGSFMGMQRSALRRRFGQSLLLRLDQALGAEKEYIIPVESVQVWQERLPCLDLIRTATGIEIALRKVLEALCLRLEKENKGLRRAVFKGYRVDGNIQQIEIGTNRASRNREHLFRLFEIKIASIEPALGFELFVLEAPVVEDLVASQDALWTISGGCDNAVIAGLLDRVMAKLGPACSIRRYLPAEHHWPERSFKLAASLKEKPTISWLTDAPRPIYLLPKPEPVEVMVRLPDYPPVHFRYKGKLHIVKKADGPERIEQEWWLQKGLFRDYYCIEDEQGARYWLFREGHYEAGQPKWFLHGFFA